MRRRLPAVGLVLSVIAACWLGLGPAPAPFAHAVLVRPDPPVNAQLREPPTVISLYFSEAVEQKISTARVLDGGGKRVDTGVEFDAQDNALMRVNVGPMAPGYYSVAWATLSKVDGHRISGSFPITILNADGSKPAGQASVDAAGTVSGGNAKPDRAVTKWLLLLSGSVVLGAFAFTWVSAGFAGPAGQTTSNVTDRRIVATAGLALIALAVFGVFELAVQADTLGGLGKVGDVLSTQWGDRWLIRNALVPPLLLITAVLSRSKRRLWSEKVPLFAGILLTLGYLGLAASVSHSAAGAGAFWATSSDFAHLVAASLWTGLLLQLALSLRWAYANVNRPERAALIASALQRFSLIAVVSVAVLMFTGTLNAIFAVGRFRDLLHSSYGLALLIKLLVILPLLVAGGFNAYVFRPRLIEEMEPERGRPDLSALGALERSLRRTVLLEGALLAAVLLVVGFLVQLPPTRAGIAAPKNVAGKFVASKNIPDLSITLVVDPNEAGDNSFETYLTGAATTVDRVRLRFIDKKKRLPDSDLVMDPSNPPLFYVGRGPFLAQGGDWQIIVDLRRNTGSDVSVPFDVTVNGPGGETGAVLAGR